MRTYLLIIAVLVFANSIHAQTAGTAFASLQLPTDARAAGFAGGSTALDADISAVSGNPARLALLASQHTAAAEFLSFPSISREAKKMALKYAVQVKERHTLGFAVNYYTTGNITLRNEYGADMALLKQNEYSFTCSYGLQVANNGYLGASLRFLNQSKLIDLTNNGTVSGSAAVGFDIGYLHNIILRDDFEKIRIGAALQNIGSKLNGLYQPMNLSIGASYSDGYYDADKYSMQEFAWLAGLQIDKPLVPTLPTRDSTGKIIAGKDPNRSVISNIFSTWTDAPGGFGENLKQVRFTIYGETLLNKRLAFRGGYTYENAAYGARTYVALGAGINWGYQESDYTVNLAYLQPIGKAASYSPLRNSFALQFLFQFGKK
jgi:hypothetical protein